MLHYLHHNQIDSEKWDACVAASAERKVYAFSWYLNVVCRQQWSAIVEVQNEEYVAVLPLPEKQRLGLWQVYQPFFTQQLGLYRTTVSIESTEAFFKQIPEKYLKVYLQLNTSNALQAAPLPLEWKLQERPNYHLLLNKPYPDLLRNYSTNQKRNLKKAKALGAEVVRGQNIETLIKLFKEEKGQELPEVKEKHYHMLADLYAQMQQHGAAQLLEVRHEGELLAAALIAVQPHQLIYLFGSASVKGKKTGAMALLLDDLIQQNAGSGLLLDFEGSTVAGVAKFYANFGAEKVTYLSVLRDKTPWYLQWLIR